jgi:hypothetical protein
MDPDGNPVFCDQKTPEHFFKTEGAGATLSDQLSYPLGDDKKENSSI